MVLCTHNTYMYIGLGNVFLTHEVQVNCQGKVGQEPSDDRTYLQHRCGSLIWPLCASYELLSVSDVG